MLQHFFNKDWWQSALAGTFGTIIGIMLTVGVTYWQQNKENVEMAYKIARITLKNLNIRLQKLEEGCEFLNAKDSVYSKLQEAYSRGGFGAVDPDSLLEDVMMVVAPFKAVSDIKSEMIFSHSFQVWQYLDNEHVISRLSNCYSAVADGESASAECYRELDDVVNRRCLLQAVKEGRENEVNRLAELLVTQPEIVLFFGKIQRTTSHLEHIVKAVRTLNERNRQALGFTVEELKPGDSMLDE